MGCILVSASPYQALNRTESSPGLPPKYPSSPLSASQSPALGWDSEKLTPRNGSGEAAGAAWPNRLRSHGSSNSLRSDAEWSDGPPGSAAEQLFYVHQLRERMAKEQVEMRSLIRCAQMRLNHLEYGSEDY